MARGLNRESGFTLVETVVAAAVLVTMLTGIAQLFVQSPRTALAARRAPVALAAAASKLEQLLALTWTYDAAGVPASDLASDTSVEPPAASGGAGLSLSPPDSLTRAAPGYVDYLDDSGRSVGTTPASGAIFARRWQVQAGTAPDLLQLRVCVIRLAGGAEEPPPEVCLGTMRGRR